MQTSRRNLLTFIGLAPVAVIAARAGAQTAAPAAAQPACLTGPLPSSQASRRRSLRYVDVSTEAGKRCGICAYFTAKSEGCGTCQLLSGGPVAATGVCSSFAKKP